MATRSTAMSDVDTMSDIPETVMRERCAGCAFRPGTEAATAPWTVALRDLCVLAGVPFECHDGGANHLCRGFVDAFTAKLRNGDYDRLPEWKRGLAVKLMDVLHGWREASERGEASDENAVMKAVADVCAAEDGRAALSAVAR